MKREFIRVGMPLFIASIIYTFYRTESTVIIKLLSAIIGSDDYLFFRNIILQNIILPDIVIYSLPEGLWIYSTTILSKKYYITIIGKRLPLFILPIIYAIILEFLQLSNLISGTFDFYDLFISIFFWLLGYHTFPYITPKQNIMCIKDRSSMICVCSYLIVYLSHVWK